MTLRIRSIWLALAMLMAAVACGVWFYRPDRALKIGTASVSQSLCDEIFVSGLDPSRAFAEEIQPQRGLRRLLRRLRYTVDADRRQVTVTWAGLFASVATYHKGYGCSQGDADALGAASDFPTPALVDDPATPITPVDAKLNEALDRAFADPRCHRTGGCALSS